MVGICLIPTDLVPIVLWLALAERIRSADGVGKLGSQRELAREVGSRGRRLDSKGRAAVTNDHADVVDSEEMRQNTEEAGGLLRRRASEHDRRSTGLGKEERELTRIRKVGQRAAKTERER